MSDVIARKAPEPSELADALRTAFIHVLVAWAVVVGVLWWISGRPMVEDADSRGRHA